MVVYMNMMTDKTWPIFILSEDDIRVIALENDLYVEDYQLDEIARRFHNAFWCGIDWWDSTLLEIIQEYLEVELDGN